VGGGKWLLENQLVPPTVWLKWVSTSSSLPSPSPPLKRGTHLLLGEQKIMHPRHVLNPGPSTPTASTLTKIAATAPLSCQLNGSKKKRRPKWTTLYWPAQLQIYSSLYWSRIQLLACGWVGYPMPTKEPHAKKTITFPSHKATVSIAEKKGSVCKQITVRSRIGDNRDELHIVYPFMCYIWIILQKKICIA